MTDHRPRRAGLSDDSGATLVFALILVTVIAVVVTALLSFGWSSLATTTQLRDQSTATATADGAAQVAVDELQRNDFVNDPASGTYPACFGTGTASDPATPGVWLPLPNLVPSAGGSSADSALVRCTPQADTGAAGPRVPLTSANKPGNAILTLSTDPSEHGLDVKALNNSTPFTVHGSVVSNSDIRVTNGTLTSSTSVTARTGCSGAIVSTPPANCTASTVPGDPGYAAEATSVPAYRTVPSDVAASCPGGVVSFQPGYYDDAGALSDLMDGNGACKHSVWWFQPGTYYFDFQNSGSHQWLVKDGQLIGGTPTDGSGNPMTRPVNPMTVPGACLNPIDSATAVGVQFLFGGDSRLQFAGSADGEICASYHTNRPPIAIYGVRSGSAAPTTMTGAAAATVTGGGFTAPAGVTLAAALSAGGDGSGATWTNTAKGNATATLSLSPFAPPGPVPAGSVLTSAKLRLVYGPAASATRSVVVTPTAGGSGSAFPVSVASGVANSTQTLDLTASLAPVVKANGYTGLTLDYSSTMTKAGTETLDAALLDLTYTVPALRGETTAAVPGNCLAQPYTGGSGGQCAVLSTTTSYSGHLYVQGTTYVPLAPVDLTVSNIAEQVLRFGVVSRTLSVKETGSIRFDGAVIEVPDDSSGYALLGTVVHLDVYVCEQAASCSPGSGRLRLRVRVLVKTCLQCTRQAVVESSAVQR